MLKDVSNGRNVMFVIINRLEEKIKNLQEVQKELSGSGNTLIIGEIKGLQDALDLIKGISIFDPEAGAKVSMDEEPVKDFKEVGGEQ